jgi:outer membrane protein
VDAASENIRKQYAGHEPTLEVVGNYGSNAQHVGNFPGQHVYQIDQKIVGVQLSIPLFSVERKRLRLKNPLP